jgi:hypothetical protein
MATNDIVQTADKRQLKVQNETKTENTLQKYYSIKIIHVTINLENCFKYSSCNYGCSKVKMGKERIVYDNHNPKWGQYIMGETQIRFVNYLRKLSEKNKRRLANYRYNSKETINNLSKKLKSCFNDMKVFTETINAIQNIKNIVDNFVKIIKEIEDFITEFNHDYHKNIFKIIIEEFQESKDNENSFYACYDSNSRNTSLETDSNPTPTSQTENTNEEEQQQSKRIKLED